MPVTGKVEGIFFLVLGTIITIIGLVILNKKRKSA
ncbi:LPXTG cell wall anchor domain-containing protein [Eubacterium multiforme]